MSKKQNVYGEGNYEASRRYYADTKKFIESGKVDAAAREAAPKSPADAAGMRQAEEAALLRSKDKKRPVREPDAPAAPIEEPDTDSDSDSDAPAEGKAPRPGRGPYRR